MKNKKRIIAGFMVFFVIGLGVITISQSTKWSKKHLKM